jgi:Zn-dependent M28 family amino/carboxypeptidase
MKMKKAKKILAAAIVVFVFQSAVLIGQDKPRVTASELNSWISFISSDEMRGRANGSPEMKKTAEWIADKFREYGLKPLLADGSFFQEYSFTSRQQSSISERNVLGFIEGSDPALKNQYLILSAHFDHIGVRKGASGDSIYNGADDNGAGTCTLIAIAKALQNAGARTGRSVIFAAFSGEESGMRGSRYFVANSPVPVKNIYADINFEMIGHSEQFGKGNFYMTGCKVSDLDDLIKTYRGPVNMNLIDTISVAEQLFYQSDNISFARISLSDEGVITGIPGGTFATTTHLPHIHAPSDEAALFDFDNMANLTEYFSAMVLWLSKSKSEINWTDPKFRRPN